MESFRYYVGWNHQGNKDLTTLRAGAQSMSTMFNVQPWDLFCTSLATVDKDDAFEIVVLTTCGQTINLDLKESDTISTMKNKIHVIKDMPCQRQELLFNGKFLNDRQSLKDCKIFNNARLVLCSTFRLSSPCAILSFGTERSTATVAMCSRSHRHHFDVHTSKPSKLLRRCNSM